MSFAERLVGWTSGVGVDSDADGQLKVALPAVAAKAGYAKIAGSSNNVLDVDASGQVKVALPTDPNLAGYVRPTGKGSNPLSPQILQGYDGRQVVGVENILLAENFDDAVVNPNRWNNFTQGMTIAMVNGWAVLNSGNALTAAAYAVLTTKKNFAMMAGATVTAKFTLGVVNSNGTNITIEAGFGSASGVIANVNDGAFFRFNAAAAKVFSSYNSTETGKDISASRPSGGNVHDCVIIVDATTVTFQIDDIVVEAIDIGSTNQAALFSGSRVPFFVRVYNANTGAATAPAQVQLGSLLVTQGHLPQNRPWDHVQALSGLGGHLLPYSPFNQSANHANAANPLSPTLSAVTPGYTTLGGRFQFSAVAGAVTDYALFAFLVSNPYQLKIHSVTISTVNIGAAVATTATILDWAIGVDGSTTYLSSSDVPASNAQSQRRVALGMQGYKVGDAIGQQAPEIRRTFENAPLVVNPTNYVHIILQIPVGTATAGQSIRGTVTIEATYE